MRLAKSVLKTLLPRGPRPRTILRGPAAGLKLEIDLQKDTQVWLGRYERDVLRWATDRAIAGSLCVDVGAAEGLFTLLLARIVGPAGSVIAVEPNPGHLRRNLQLNPGFAPIHVCEGFAGDGEAGTLSVEALVQATGKRLAFAKIDVDGAEAAVLAGMRGILERDRPPLALELHSHALRDACFGILEPIGYRCEIKTPARHEYRPLDYNMHLFAEAR